MKEKQNKTQKTKTNKQNRKLNLVFGIIYTVLEFILLAAVIIDNNMPNSKTSDLVFFILMFVIVELFLFLMFTQNFIKYKNKKKQILSYLVFVVNAVIFALKLVVSYDIFLLILFIYNSILGAYITIDFTLYKTKHPTVKFFDKKIYFVIAFSLILLLTNALSHNYINSGLFWLYSAIAMIIFLIIFIVLSFTVFKNTYKQFAKKVLVKICVGFIATILSLCYAFVFVDIANTSFNNNPKQIECVVVDKNISGTGYRQITHYTLYVLIDNKKTAIDVSLDTYKTKQIDDTLIVNYHKGNLNLSYYESAE